MRTPLPRMSRRGRVTLIVLAACVLLFMFLGCLVNAWTDYLWFSEVHYTGVFTRVLWTRVGLFLVFGALIALIVWFNLWLPYRVRQLLRPHSAEQQSLDRYRMLLTPRFGLWIGLLAGIIGFFSGISAQGRWAQWLLFANRQNFGVKDPQFHLDIGFYVFDYPFWRYLIGVGFTAVVLCVLGSLAVHYLFGGVRLQGAGERMTGGARAHLTALVAAFVLLKAVAYFLDQRGLVLSHNGGTGLWGAGYTDVQALLPAKEILAYISVVVAVAILVFSNAFIRNLVWPGIAIGMLALSAVAIGGVYPAGGQTFTVKPNIRDKERPYIERSIQATRAAVGLSDVGSVPYGSGAPAPPGKPTAEVGTRGTPRAAVLRVRVPRQADRPARLPVGERPDPGDRAAHLLRREHGPVRDRRQAGQRAGRRVRPADRVERPVRDLRGVGWHPGRLVLAADAVRVQVPGDQLPDLQRVQQQLEAHVRRRST